jgi:hypothetical protein
VIGAFAGDEQLWRSSLAEEHDHHMTPVIHQPRVAWDGACAFVRAAGSPCYPVFADYVRQWLGPDLAEDLTDTHDRLFDNLVRTGGDRHVGDVEAGKWRVRLEDLLRSRPETIGAVMELTTMVPRY